MGIGAPYTHRLALNVWAGSGARPAPSAAARAHLAEDPVTGGLTGTDPAGVGCNAGPMPPPPHRRLIRPTSEPEQMPSQTPRRREPR